MQQYSFSVIFEPAEEGGYTVIVPALPGCVTEGDTLDEAKLMAVDAIKAYCESLKKDEKPIPQERSAQGAFIGQLNVAMGQA